MHLAGLVLGLVLLIVSCGMAFMSMRMLMLAATKTGLSSYGELFGYATQWRFAPFILDMITILFGQGVIIAYFVFLSDFIPPVADAFGLNLERWVCVLVCFMGTIPFTIPPKLSALQNITPLTTISLMITAFAVMYRTPTEVGLLDSSTTIELGHLSLGTLKSFTLTISVFICHTNVVSVAEEFVNPSDRRSTKVVSRVSAILLIIYMVLSVCGYVSFGSSVQENFIKNYSEDDQLINICRILLSLSIFFGIPLNTHPTVRSILSIYKNGFHDIDQQVQSESTMDVSITESLLPGHIDGADHPMGSSESGLHENCRIAVGVFVNMIGAVVSLYVPGIADVVSVLAGSLGTMITLLFPAMIYESVYEDRTRTYPSERFQVYSLYIGSLLCFTSVGLSLCGYV